MFHPARLVPSLLPFLALATALCADPSLEQARRAQALLGPDIWSEIVRVENDTRGGRYPSCLHALVFELAGILWFYTETDGTQSFSLHAGRLAEEKADIGPLLRDIEPGFSHWTVTAAERLPPATGGGSALRNGCFIESIAALRKRLAGGEPMERPRLLSFYVPTRTGLRGHTVLAFGHGGQLEVLDSSQPRARLVFPQALGDDALMLARAIEGPAVMKARYVSIELAVPATGNLISTVNLRSTGDALAGGPS